MSHNSYDSDFLQPDDGGPMIGYSALTSHADKRDFECRVAQRILRWLETCDFPWYVDYIRDVSEDAFGSEYMERLGFGLWRHLDASMWLKWQDAPGSSSVLWQYAILRTAEILNAQ